MGRRISHTVNMGERSNARHVSCCPWTQGGTAEGVKKRSNGVDKGVAWAMDGWQA